MLFLWKYILLAVCIVCLIHEGILAFIDINKALFNSDKKFFQRFKDIHERTWWFFSSLVIIAFGSSYILYFLKFMM